MKNWRTTLAGAVIGGGYFLLSALQHGVTPRDAFISAGLVVLGALAKDLNVTGGTVSQ